MSEDDYGGIYTRNIDPLLGSVRARGLARDSEIIERQAATIKELVGLLDTMHEIMHMTTSFMGVRQVLLFGQWDEKYHEMKKRKEEQK